METVGIHLKQQREKAGIGLDQIATVTKIRLSLLCDLENDRLDSLPNGVFLRGFVRAYAEAISIRPDRALEILDSQTAPEETGIAYSSPIAVGEEPTGSKFKIAHLLVLVFALLTMLGAYFLTAGTDTTRSAVTSAQTTDADSGTTRSFSPLKRHR